MGLVGVEMTLNKGRNWAFIVVGLGFKICIRSTCVEIRPMLQKNHLGCIFKFQSFLKASILQNWPIFGHLLHYLDLGGLHNISNIFGSYT